MPSKPVCEYSRHIPMRVQRGKKGSLWVCEVCGHRLHLEKKEKGAVPIKDVRQGSLFE